MPITPELDERRDAIMKHFSRCPGYPNATVSRIAETPAGGVMIQGSGHEKNQFGGDREIPFTVSYSKWEIDQVLQRS